MRVFSGGGSDVEKRRAMTYREGIVAAARRAGRAALDNIFAVVFQEIGRLLCQQWLGVSRNNGGPIDQRGINWEGRRFVASELGSIDRLNLSLNPSSGKARNGSFPDSSLESRGRKRPTAKEQPCFWRREQERQGRVYQHSAGSLETSAVLCLLHYPATYARFYYAVISR